MFLLLEKSEFEAERFHSARRCTVVFETKEEKTLLNAAHEADFMVCGPELHVEESPGRGGTGGGVLMDFRCPQGDSTL